MTGIIAFFIPLLFMFAIFYFLLIRPQNKKQAKLRKMVSEIKENDIVFTYAGIKATVIAIEENELVIESEGSKLRVLKNAVADVES